VPFRRVRGEESKGDAKALLRGASCCVLLYVLLIVDRTYSLSALHGPLCRTRASGWGWDGMVLVWMRICAVSGRWGKGADGRLLDVV
jgi:hypothetical protein